MYFNGTPVDLLFSSKDDAFGKSLFHFCVYCDFFDFTPLFVLKGKYAMGFFQLSVERFFISPYLCFFRVFDNPLKYFFGKYIVVINTL